MKKLTINSLFIIILSVNAFGQSNTQDFEVTKSGQGNQSIIFIAGFASSGELWDETKAKYEKDFTCYVLTMAGFAGVSPNPKASFKNWEASLANFIKKNKISRPTIIGHSMGGGLALALASDYPELIGKIVVVDALPCLPALINPVFKVQEKPDCSAMIDQMISASPEQFYQLQKMSISRLVADTSKQELVISWSIKSDRRTFAEMYCDFSNTDLREKIQSIKCPALILLEAYFKNIKPAIEEQYKNGKTADLHYSNKGLHFIMYDDREWYFSKLNNFMTTK